MSKHIRTLEFNFRFPVHQVAEQTVAVEIPMGGDIPIINKEFAKAFNLSDAEQDEAETEVLRSIAIIR